MSHIGSKVWYQKYWLELLAAAVALLAIFIIFRCLRVYLNYKKVRSAPTSGAAGAAILEMHSFSSSENDVNSGSRIQLPPNWIVRYVDGLPVYENTMTKEKYDFREMYRQQQQQQQQQQQSQLQRSSIS